LQSGGYCRVAYHGDLRAKVKFSSALYWLDPKNSDLPFSVRYLFLERLNQVATRLIGDFDNYDASEA